MDREEYREFTPLLLMATDEPYELHVLQSQYNRCASRLNSTIFDKETSDTEELLIELAELKDQIDKYD